VQRLSRGQIDGVGDRRNEVVVRTLALALMRIGIQSWGSEGDLYPLVALATRLRELGHAPSLLFTVVDGKDHGAHHDIPLRLVPESMASSLEDVVRSLGDASPTKILEAIVEQTFRPYPPKSRATSMR
jgi:sterol 3beta-glucosyltransferase